MILKPPLFAKPIHGHPLGPDGGLAGFWPMNEGGYNSTFDKVFDLSGNGNTGTLTGTAPARTAGKFGSAVSLPGTDEKITVDSSPVLNPGTGNYTFSFWIKTNEISVNNVGLLNKGYTNNFLIIKAVALLRIYLASGTPSISQAGYFTVGDWILTTIVLTNNDTVTLYKNGTYLTVGSYTGTLSNTTALTIGYYATYFNGLIDNISFYKRALSASEIALLYREPFCMFEYDPIELWSAATQGEEAPPVGMAGAMTTNTGYWGW